VLTVTACEHVLELGSDPVARTPNGCEECLAEGGRWVHLRLCLACGHVGCCDSSPSRHASAHFAGTTHPVIRSFQPGEDWRWCFVDQVLA
jgi:CPA1 family monovalent cation:H+ antiporter